MKTLICGGHVIDPANRVNGKLNILIEDDKIDCIVTLPGGLFSTTSIPVCLWFMARNKLKNGHRDRHGEILFIDARNMET